MPKLGNTVEECILGKWRKNQGDKVAAGEVIAEIETDKATFDLTAPVDGTFLGAFFAEGALVPVFTNICVIGNPGESIEQFKPAAAAAPAAPKPAAASPATVTAPRQATSSPAPAASEVFLSPRARRFAAEHELVPPPMAGSGPGGRVLEQDLKERYQASPQVSSLARKRMAAGYEARHEGSGIHGMILARDLDQPPVRMSSMRERIARRMRESLSTSAQYTMNTSADATGLLSLRAKIKAARQKKDIPDINVNDMIMFAVIKALADMPELNAELIDGKLYRRQEVHLGFACDTDRGLLVPVIRNASTLSLEELSRKGKALTEQALGGSITPDDLTGATFTVSNLGNLGIQSFTPILNSPQVAILGVDSIELKPVRRAKKVEFVDHIGLSLTCDHQAIDGAPGARFLKILREKIETFEAIADLKV